MELYIHVLFHINIDTTIYTNTHNTCHNRWKRRHFVLTDDLLEYWDKLADYALGKEGKTFFLTGSTQTSFTSTQNCFCVNNPSDDSEASSWYLLADSEK